MRKATPYVIVAMMTCAVTWFAATRRGDHSLPAVPPEPPVNVDDLPADEQPAVRVYQNVNRSVVHITTRGVSTDDFGFSETREGSGSGSVVDKNGHILTNNHVVENGRRIDVLLYDGSSHEAKLIGTD